MRHGLVAAIASLAATACEKPTNEVYGAPASTVELQAGCATKIKEELLNPETAQFYDFEQIPYSTYVEGADAAIADELASIGERQREAARSIRIVSESPVGATYRMRVRAEGKLGNTITSFAWCQVTVTSSPSSCMCLMD
jgi:hypothetical protein